MLKLRVYVSTTQYILFCGTEHKDSFIINTQNIRFGGIFYLFTVILYVYSFPENVIMEYDDIALSC
jgi:predicted membrane channel-forming protein YqfA (hemolysin III family)